MDVPWRPLITKVATMLEYRNEHTRLCKQPLGTFVFSERRMEEYDG